MLTFIGNVVLGLIGFAFILVLIGVSLGYGIGWALSRTPKQGKGKYEF